LVFYVLGPEAQHFLLISLALHAAFRIGLCVLGPATLFLPSARKTSQDGLCVLGPEARYFLLFLRSALKRPRKLSVLRARPLKHGIFSYFSDLARKTK
jgi:hypothetical protein